MNSMTRLKALRLHQDITFGLDGNDAPFIGEGWADADFGHRRMRGSVCEIRMIHPGRTDLLLELAAAKTATTAAAAAQPIEIDLNGRMAATIEAPDQLPRAAYVPAGRVPAGQILTLRLRLPSAKPPADGRTDTLGMAFSGLRLFTLRGQAATIGSTLGDATTGHPCKVSAASPKTILGFFEGLGDSGEFGAVQRHAGVRPAGLLPYAFNSLHNLVRALDAGFAGIGDPATFDVLLHSPTPLEHVVVDKTYGAEFRGLHEPGEIRLSAFIEEQGARLRDVRRELMRTVGAGEKIFIVYRGGPGPALSEQEVLPLLIALNRHGPNHLLWVTPADAANPPGTVRRKMPFLLQGAIDRFRVGQDAKTIAFDTWLLLCRNALDIAFPSGAPGAATMDGVEPAWLAGEHVMVQQAADGVAGPSQAGSALPDTAVPERDPAPPNMQFSSEGSRVAPTAPAFPPGQAATTGHPDDYALLQSWRFGEAGNEEAVLGFGWSGPEDGFRWTEGPACELWLDHPGKRDVFVVVEAWPFVMPPEMPVQRAEFSAHDAPLGTLAFTETSRLALPVAATTLRPGRVMRLRCELPDAAKPSDAGISEDERQLGLGFMRVYVHAAPARAHRQRTGSGGISIDEALQRTGLATPDFLGRFEPLGETQNLANLQVDLGHEGQGLFHRASLRLLDLVRVLDTRLEGVGDPAKLQAELIGGDPELYEIRDETTGLSFVAERAKSDANPEMLAARQARRLKFQRDQLLHDLSAGQKIFVFHRPLQEAAPTEPEMLALLLSLRQHGPATLLFLTGAADPHPPGTVEHHYPGLLQGYLNEAETDNGNEAVWLEVLANALLLTM